MIPQSIIFSLFFVSSSIAQDSGLFSIFNNQQEVEEYQGWNLMEDFDILHHVIRMRHHSPELRINVSYVMAARQRAVEYLLRNGKPDAFPLPLDENVHFHSNADEQVSADDAMKVWYRDAEKNYDYQKPEVNQDNISFARIVSKTTQEYGCGQARLQGEAGGIYTVCFYSPPYVIGNEAENIQLPQYAFEPEADMEAAQNGE